MARLSAVLLLIVAAPHAPAAWVEKGVSDETSSVRGLVHRYVVVEDSESGARVSMDFALFAQKACKLRVIDNPEGADLADAMRRTRCLAGINGGYFDPNFNPLGLRIIDGKITSRLTRGRLMTGVLCSNNLTQLFRAGEFSAQRKASAAVQAGPFLVDQGRRVMGLEATRSARRTFAAVGKDQVALGFCSDVSLADLSEILATARLGDAFKVTRALNFDGGSSSAFWFKRDARAFSIPEHKTVRDFVGVVPK